MKRFISFALIFVMLFCMAFVCSANEVISVTFSVYDSKNDEYIASPLKSSVLENSSVLSLLLDSVSNVDTLDNQVVSISGIHNSSASGYKWVYRLNGATQNITADLCYLKENDVIEWIYMESPEIGNNPEIVATTTVPTTHINTTIQNNTVKPQNTAISNNITTSPLNTQGSKDKNSNKTQVGSTDSSSSTTMESTTETTIKKTKNKIDNQTKTREISETFNSTLASTLDYVIANNGDYTTVVLNLFDKEIPDYLKDSIKTKAENNSITLSEKIHLLLTISSIGENPETFSPLELKKQIYNSTDLISYGLDNVVFSLLYSTYVDLTGEELYNEDTLVDLILQNQNADGSFSKTYNSAGDVDITALTLVALSDYQRYPSVTLATDRALAWLSTQQNSDGTFNDVLGVKNCKSTAYVLMALSSLELKVEEDNLIQNSKDLFEGLLLFFDGKAFTHQIGSATSVEDSEAVLLAVAAYQLQINPLSVDFSSLNLSDANYPFVNFIVFSVFFALLILSFYIWKRRGNKNG